jgi:hypothetical protein
MHFTVLSWCSQMLSKHSLFFLIIPGATARSLWSNTPGDYGNFITTAFPLGNGRLGGTFRPGLSSHQC